MPIPESNTEDGQLFTSVDDEQYDELSELNGQPIVHISVWEEGLADTMSPGRVGQAGAAIANDNDKKNDGRDDRKDDGEDGEIAADIDLYLRDGVYFELYGTLCYTNLDEAPLADLAQIEQRLQALVSAGAVLEEIAVDEDDGLVLVLGLKRQPVFYLQVGAWLLDEWEELPDLSTP